MRLFNLTQLRRKLLVVFILLIRSQPTATESKDPGVSTQNAKSFTSTPRTMLRKKGLLREATIP